MKMTLRTKLSISYVFVVLIGIILIGILANYFVERQFKQYVIDEMEKRNLRFINLMEQQLALTDGLNLEGIEAVGTSGLEEGLVITVRDLSGRLVWSAMEHNQGICHDMLNNMASNMHSKFANWQGGYEEMDYLVTSGIVTIGYYGPFYYNDSDLAFINTLNQVLIVTGIICFGLCLLVSSYISNRIAKPLLQINLAAIAISEGNYEATKPIHTTTIELVELDETIHILGNNLKVQEDLRKQLTGDVTHELRTPLATLQSHLEAMIDGIWEADAERLKSCHEEVVRINKMVGDLERVAKYEQGTLVLLKTEFDIAALIQSIMNQYEIACLNKQIEMRFVGVPTMITGDKDKLTQVIINLITNSVKYTPNGGNIALMVTEEGKEIKIMIADNGIGIPEEDLPYIFERFYRVDKSRSRMSGGAGIGLTIVKSIVQGHQGKIHVESRLGEGSRFIVILPK